MTWEDDLRRKSTPVLVYELKTNNQEIFKKIRKEVKEKSGKHITDMLIHFWPPLSYLDWHTDAGYSDALTIYLNKEWNPNWGGYFLYNQGSGIQGLIPQENLGILQKGGTPHCVTTINMDSDIRMSLQTFLQSSKKIL
jgi:Rps23 Pro-64 3,4-dihydroxylase Tpa1-like proline 4-hydroxylase